MVGRTSLVRAQSIQQCSDIFGDFENFVNIIGKDCGEVGSRVPGHVGAEGNFTNILGILNVPNFWHATPRPGEKIWKRKMIEKERKEED